MSEENKNENKEPEKAIEYEDVLGKYNTKKWWLSFLFGIILGIAVVVPGISGAAIAIIFKLYDKMIFAFGNLFKKFSKCFFFLLPIGIGFIVGFPAGFFAIKWLLGIVPFAMICCFAGLMIGSFPVVFQEIKGSSKTTGKSLVFLSGILVPLLIGGIAVLLSKGSFEDPYLSLTQGEDTKDYQLAIDTFKDFPWWLYVIAVPIGFVLGLTQVVPGLSATAFLMMIGYFKALVSSVSMEYFKLYPQIFAFYLLMAVGVILGFVLTSKVIDKLFSWNRDFVYHLIVGLSLGSIIAIFLNTDSVAIYVAWANGLTQKSIIDLAISLPLMVAGFFGSYSLVRYQRKHESHITD